MRVGVDISICSFNSAGNARYSSCLVDALHRTSHDNQITVIPLNLPARLWSTVAGFQRKITVFFWEFVYAPYVLAQLCRTHKCDLLHTTAPLPVAGIHCPLVVTILDMTPVFYPEWFPKVMGMRLRRWIRVATRNAEHIITISQNTASDVYRALPSLHTPITPVYLGSFLEDLTVQSSPDQLPEPIIKDRYILAVGTLEPRKNLRLVLDAYQALHHQIANPPHLVVVGAKGWMIHDIEAEVRRLRIDTHTTLMGFVTDSQLRTLYAHAEMLVYPSLYEGFGFPVLEAMSIGCPVITSNVSSLPEVAHNIGILIDPKNMRQLVSAMQQILLNPSLASKMRQNGLERARRFSWKRCAQETIEVYRSVIDGTNRP